MELEVVASYLLWELGTKLRSSARSASAFNSQAAFLALQPWCFNSVAVVAVRVKGRSKESVTQTRRDWS